MNWPTKHKVFTNECQPLLNSSVHVCLEVLILDIAQLTTQLPLNTVARGGSVLVGLFYLIMNSWIQAIQRLRNSTDLCLMSSTPSTWARDVDTWDTGLACVESWVHCSTAKRIIKVVVDALSPKQRDLIELTDRSRQVIKHSDIYKFSGLESWLSA